MATAIAAADGPAHESFSFWFGLAIGALLVAGALVMILQRRRGHMMPRTIPVAWLLYGLGSLLNSGGQLLPEPAATALAVVMVLVFLAALTCFVVGLRELRRSRAS